MDTDLIIILATFAVIIVAGFATLYIRKYGKEHGTPTEDIEAGINVAKDGAISELEDMKNKTPKLK